MKLSPKSFTVPPELSDPLPVFVSFLFALSLFPSLSFSTMSSSALLSIPAVVLALSMSFEQAAKARTDARQAETTQARIALRIFLI